MISASPLTVPKQNKKESEKKKKKKSRKKAEFPKQKDLFIHR